LGTNPAESTTSFPDEVSATHNGNQLTPIEVKWTEKPALNDARHLLTFLDEKSKGAKHGFVVCRCPRPLQLHEKITALPWFCL
jgi:hypothetical protein